MRVRGTNTSTSIMMRRSEMVGVGGGESGHHGAERLDAVQEIRARVVDRHARAVRILCPTLGGGFAQVIPDLFALAEVDLRGWWGGLVVRVISAVHRLELGPLIRRSPIAKRIPCHRYCRFQLLPRLGFARQVGW